LVQANFGARSNLIMNGLPVGQWLKDSLLPQLFHSPNKQPQQDGSIIGVLATNAPLLPQQLKRLARRMGLGVARTGGVAYNTSGDFFLAFSTVAPTLQKGMEHWQVLPNTQLDPLLEAATYATEEAILNALCAAEAMTGIHGNRVEALPREQVRAWIAQYQAPVNL
jgi:L-aminopeptidase/D-esterase-like protein